jgi:hypothetical protein
VRYVRRALATIVLLVLAAGSSPAQPPTPVVLPPAFAVHLPDTLRQFPEALSAGKNSPGFPLRGIKGWMWSAPQYLAEIPVLAEYRMNFLMNCYTSMFDIEHHAWGGEVSDCNRWWEPLPEEKKRAYEEVVRACARAGIQFCFCMNPNLTSRRFANPDIPQDVADLWQHYRWMQDLGVRWFSICLDDIGEGKDPRMQAKLVNDILRRLRVRDPGAQMIFCPTYYAGDGSAPGAAPYLTALAADLDSLVYIFWTGNATVARRITRAAAERYKTIIGRRLILWDNYPVNDSHPTMNLGPVSGRDSDLCTVVDGYMSNSLCPQNEINRIPMLTCADYAYNPWDYDAGRSIGQSIAHLGKTDRQREALAALVKAYPGNLWFGTWYSYNPVRAGFLRADSLPDGGVQSGACISATEGLMLRLVDAFPDQFLDARRTVDNDINWMNEFRAKKHR